MYLYGASGHGKVLLEVAQSQGFEIKAFIDDFQSLTELHGLPVLKVIPEVSCDLAISIGNNQSRKEISEKFHEYHFPILIHARSTISKSASVNCGSVVMMAASVNTGCVIGKFVIINTNASVDHDCIIGDYVHISPGATICGSVQISEGTHIGAGATLIPGVRIGKWCIIGAGSVILHDIPDFSVVVGVPGRVIRKSNMNE